MADFDWYPYEEIGEERAENYNFDSAINYTGSITRDNFSALEWYMNLCQGGLRTTFYDGHFFWVMRTQTVYGAWLRI